MNVKATAIWICFLVLVRAASAAADAAPPLTLEKIMADPDWIGRGIADAYWSADGRSVYYPLKRYGSPVVDLHRVSLADRRDQAIDSGAMSSADGPPVYDRAGKRAAFARNGDIFVRDISSGRLTQITRSLQEETAPRFSADGRLLTFRAGNDWYIHDFGSGVTAAAAVLKTEKDPKAAPDADDMRDMQLRVFSTLKKLRDDSEITDKNSAAMRNADATRAAAPYYLGDDIIVRGTQLSPDGRWMLVVTESKSYARGIQGNLTRYVTESGYEEFEKERLRVGRNSPAPQSLLLLNLVDHTLHPLAVDNLPGIHDDPLRSVREENAKLRPPGGGPADGAQKPADGAQKPELRNVWVISYDPEVNAPGMIWSGDGTSLAVEIFSMDNKDRWITRVDLQRFQLVPQHRISDASWVNEDSFYEFGWLNDNQTLWFESEESGFGHLYVKAPGAAAKPLTQGRFEVSAPQLSADGRWFYVLSNAEQPYAYDVYRVPSGGGSLQRLTKLQGVEGFVLDGRGDRLLITHSSPYVPPQIAVAKADGSDAAQDLTDTRRPEFKSLSWIAPEIVKVPSTHFDGVIYAKVYRAAQAESSTPRAGSTPRPGVVFVHGAGYLQDVHLRYSYYFREQMFNNWLVQHGYTVIDVDYRASAGYGRDWRTAIYRQMGHPELEDLLDAKKWLVEQAGVDPKRVGMYGGSYGGFMTLMALFRAPGEFAAGAALRPVTDWMQYDHDYTSGILNDPQIDPIAYRRSSPLEFADGLQDPLLICHGVTDDNVLFEDSMRLYQRLIELHKDNFAISPYPLDRHAFTNADSWLDEYKRISRLFETYLK